MAADSRQPGPWNRRQADSGMGGPAAGTDAVQAGQAAASIPGGRPWPGEFPAPAESVRRRNAGPQAARAGAEPARPPHYRGKHGPVAAWPATKPLSRRNVLLGASALAAAAGTLEILERLAWIPEREAQAGTGGAAIGDVQFDIGPFLAPVRTIDGVQVQFGPVHTVFATARLRSPPTVADQAMLAGALDQIEQAYAWSPTGMFTHVAYGLPYFAKLPDGLAAQHLPQLAGDPSRSVLEEAVPSPTDVHPSNPGVTKQRFGVPVRIEENDLLFTFRSDRTRRIRDVLNWLRGSGQLRGSAVPSPDFGGRLVFTSSRAMFGQAGLPRRIADAIGVPWARMVNPRSPMWMGFADQQVKASAPAPFVTFQGADGFRITTAQPGDYFDNGAIQHLSHVILDLQQFYDVDDAGEPQADAAFTERVQYMFRSTPPPSIGFSDQITDGGGPAFLENEFKGSGDALTNARGDGTPENKHRMGHVAALHRSSRTPDGRPIHLRIDGPGFDDMDVPGGGRQPKLQFSAFFPSADFFATMRRNLAAQDLAEEFTIDPDENGLERFSTATRRQNFVIPPRRNRAFPLAEFGGPVT